MADQIELKPNELTGQSAVRTKHHKHDGDGHFKELEKTLPIEEKKELEELIKEKKDLKTQLLTTKDANVKKQLEEVEKEIKEIFTEHQKDMKAEKSKTSSSFDNATSLDDFSDASGETMQKSKKEINGKSILVGTIIGVLVMWAINKKYNLF